MRRQLDLFSAPVAAFDGAWVDHERGWVAGHDALFEELERALAWRHEKRHLYGEAFVRTTAALYRDGRAFHGE